jgi:hypothetical protein
VGFSKPGRGRGQFIRGASALAPHFALISIDMADLSEFSVEDFDIASFINRASSRHLEASADQPDSSSSGLDKILSELEMRLQLTAEDIESSLHDLSMQALRRIPYAVQEIYRLKGDVQGMQDRLGGLTSDISRDAQQAKGAVSGLVQLDRAKRNMEAACSTLREATELNGLFIKVEQVFAEGDLPRVAEMLSSMRKSLNLVGDVPEFRSGREKLKALEDRLQSQVEGSLGEALSVKGADAMAKEETIGRLCTLLLAVDRLSTVESLYCSSRLSFIKTAWEEMVVASGVPNAVHGLNRFLSWLPSFIEQEAAWCIRVLPEHHLRIILASSRFSSAWISDRLKDHLNMLIGTASKLSTMHLAPPAAFSLLVGLQRDLSSVASTLSAVLRLADGPIRKDILLLVFAPIEERVLSYSSIEDAVLSSSMPSSTTTTSVTPSSDGKKGAEEVVAMILVQSKAAFTAMHQAIERCLLFTGGTELPSLLRVMDKELSGIVARMQVQVKSLQDHHALSFNSKGGEGSFDEEEEVASTLKLLLSHADLSSRLLSLEAEIRTTVSSAVLKMEAAAADQGQGSSDPVSLRLSAPERIARVRKLLTSLGLSKGATDDEASKPTAAFLALPLSSSAAASLHVAIEAVLLDALLSKVRVSFISIHSYHTYVHSIELRTCRDLPLRDSASRSASCLLFSLQANLEFIGW